MTDNDPTSTAKAANASDPVVDRVGDRERLRQTQEAIRFLEGLGYKVTPPGAGGEPVAKGPSKSNRPDDMQGDSEGTSILHPPKTSDPS